MSSTRTAAPEVLLFKRFKAQWNFLDERVFTTIDNNEELSKTVKVWDVIARTEKSLREK